MPEVEVPPELVGQSVTFRMESRDAHVMEKWDCCVLVPVELLDLSAGRAAGRVVEVGRDGGHRELAGGGGDSGGGSDGDSDGW